MQKSYLQLIYCTLCVILCGGCSAYQIPPRVSLVDVAIGETSLFETTLKTMLRYHNRSSQAIRIRGSSHTLTLNGLDVGSAASDRNLTIPPLGSAREELVFYVDNLALLRRLQPLIKTRDLHYDLETTIYTGDWWGSVTIDRQGQLRDLVPMDPADF